MKALKTLADVIDFVTASGGTVVHGGGDGAYRCRLKYRLPNRSEIVCSGKGDSSTAAALDAARKLSQQLRGDVP